MYHALIEIEPSKFVGFNSSKNNYSDVESEIKEKYGEVNIIYISRKYGEYFNKTPNQKSPEQEIDVL